jgi:hypothetical protein
MSEPTPETAATYAERANRYRPTDPDTMAEAVFRLACTGLTARDIGAAVGLQPDQILTMLRHTGQGDSR